MKSNSVNGNVAVISDIFRNFTLINFQNYPRISPRWVHRGFCVKLQKIYDIDKQPVAYFLNIPTYGRKWYLELMEESEIWLPSLEPNSEIVPNWEFMEEYIKRLPYSSNI